MAATPKGHGLSCCVTRPSKSVSISMHDIGLGARPRLDRRCLTPLFRLPAGQWPQLVAIPHHLALRTAVQHRRHFPAIIISQNGITSTYKRYRTIASTMRGRGNADSSGSRGGNGGDSEAEAEGMSWVTGDGDDPYSYLYDPELQPPGLGGRSASMSALVANLTTIDDTNALQTALAAAIKSEDFDLAAAVRDRLRQVTGSGQAAGRIDWASTGMNTWLADRAQRLGYRFPTEIQRRSAPVLLAGSDAVVASETGSGKTLSFLMPLLARMSYPPDIFLDEMKGPQGLVVVPTLELGVQVALTAFRLLGGNVSAGRPGDPANMFTYFGPKGIRVRGILNKEEVVMAKSSLTYTAQVHLLVATPGALMEAVREPQPAANLIRHLKVLAVDEVDECFGAFPGDMDELMRLAADSAGRGNSSGSKPQVIFVGATQRQDILQTAVARGWLREPVSIQVGREGTVPPALSHRYIVVQAERRLAALARSLRADLAAADEDAAPARVMLFVNTPAEAAAVAEPLRSSLWSDHRMAVLVPPGTILGRDAASDDPPGLRSSSPSSSSSPYRSNRSSSSSSSSGPGGMMGSARGVSGVRGEGSAFPASGSEPSDLGARSGFDGGVEPGIQEAIDDMLAYNPIRALHSFRDNKSTLLLATGAAARGLDLPGVSHVYSLGPPPDATQYLHRAGRAGRIGSTSGGIVTTLVTSEELPALLEMGRQLGIRLIQETEATGELVGMLPRLPAPPDEDSDLPEVGEDGKGLLEPVVDNGGGSTGSGPGSGSEARRGLGPGGNGGSGDASREVGRLDDVEKLRKGLEDLFNLM